MKSLAFLFILLSIWTDPIGELDAGFLGRMVPADLVGLVLILFLALRRKKLQINGMGKAGLVVVLSFVPGLIVSTKPFSTLLEILILLFLVIVFFAFCNIFKTEADLEDLIKYFALASLLAAFIGLWNLISTLVGIPAIPVFNPRAALVGIGTFRNTGQAGAYMGVALAVLIPVRFSGLYKNFRGITKTVITAAIPLCLVFLVATTKRAALIGFAAGAFFWFVMNIQRIRFKKKVVFTFFAVISLLLVVGSGFIYLFEKNETMRNQLLYKWIQKTPEFFDEDSFVMENYGLAFQAFLDNPLLGTGIGGFAGRYSNYEVHSTYIKMFAETGIIGFLGYLFFVFVIFKKKKLNLKGPCGDFIRNMTPFLIGLFVSWSYTFHLRKREFWILLAIFTIASRLALEFRNGKVTQKIETSRLGMEK